MTKPAQIKTKETQASVADFIQGIKDEQMKTDCKVLAALMQKHSGEKPKMWGTAMVGFGLKRYKSAKTGREVDWFKIGFSPRKANLSLHLVADFHTHKNVLSKLGKHKTGVGCLYINGLSDIDLNKLETLIEFSLKEKQG